MRKRLRKSEVNFKQSQRKMTDKHKNTEKKRTAEKVFSLIGGFLALSISLITLLIVSISDSVDFKIVLLLICSIVIVVSGFLLNKKVSLAFSLMIIFSIVGLLTNVLIFIFPFIFILIGLFTGVIKGRTIGNFVFSTMKAILVSVLLVILVVYLGFFQPIISKNNEVNNLFTKMDNLEKDFGMAGTEKDIKYDIYKEYSQLKTDSDTAIKNPPVLWIFFPEAYSFIIIKPNFQKMVDTANTVEYMKSRVFPEGYVMQQIPEILDRYVNKEKLIKPEDIPCASDIDCLYLYACVNHQCKSKEYVESTKSASGEPCVYDADCKEGFTCAKGTTYDYECTKIECAEDKDCEEKEFCNDGVCQLIECQTDEDCEEGYYCKNKFAGCTKTISNVEIKNGYKYETMIEDGMTFIWCNYKLDEECPNGYTYGMDGKGDSFCRKECTQDSDCPANQFCLESKGFCDWGSKDYSDYE